MDLNEIVIGKKYLYNNAEVTVTKVFFNNFISVTDGKNEYACKPGDLENIRHRNSLFIEEYISEVNVSHKSAVDMFRMLNGSLIYVIGLLEKHAKKVHDPNIKECINELRVYVVPNSINPPGKQS